MSAKVNNTGIKRYNLRSVRKKRSVGTDESDKNLSSGGVDGFVDSIMERVEQDLGEC